MFILSFAYENKCDVIAFQELDVFACGEALCQKLVRYINKRG